MPTDASATGKTARPVHARVTTPDEDNDVLTEKLFRAAAKDEGLSYHDWCEKWGIVGPSQRRKLRRHEVAAADLSEGARRDMVNRTAWEDKSLKSANGSVITVSAPTRGLPRRKRDDDAGN